MSQSLLCLDEQLGRYLFRHAKISSYLNIELSLIHPTSEYVKLSGWQGCQGCSYCIGKFRLRKPSRILCGSDPLEQIWISHIRSSKRMVA